MSALGEIWILLAVFVSASIAPQANRFHLPDLSHPEQGRVIGVDRRQKERWRQSWSMAPVTGKGRKMVEFTESGRGRYAPFEQEVSWKNDSTWEIADALRPAKAVRRFFDPDGKILVEESIELDFQSHKARIRKQKPNSIGIHEERISIPDDTLILSGLPTVLRGFPFESEDSIRFHLLAYEPKL